MLEHTDYSIRFSGNGDSPLELPPVLVQRIIRVFVTLHPDIDKQRLWIWYNK